MKFSLSKYNLWALITITSQVSASGSAIMKTMDKLRKSHKNRCSLPEFRDSLQCRGRSFNSAWASEIVQSINGYGCWCYFQEDHGKGRGIPMNEVDAQCKILQDGYSCILMDAVDEGDLDCVPWDVEYNSATGLGMMVDDPNNDNVEKALRTKCNKANKKNNCAARACMVENYFVIQTVKLFLTGVEFDPSLKHDLGNFNAKEECVIKQGQHGKSDKQCCGNYPLRFPYKTLNGDRGCCVKKTYNTLRLQCCSDGSLKFNCNEILQ